MLLAYAIITTSAVNALIRRSPTAAASVSPTDPRVVFSMTAAEFRRNKGTIGRSTAAAAVSAIRRAPLAEEPFLYKGLEAALMRNHRLAERLHVEARRRNPRSRLARLLLLDRYLRTQRTAQAAGEIAVLNRLIPGAERILVPELAKFAANSRTRDALAKALRNDPSTQQAILKHLAITGSDPGIILALARATASPANGEDFTEWQSALVQSLIAKGDIRRAYELWADFAVVKAVGDWKGVYDGRFEGLRGAPPFNWLLNAGGGGVAERTRPSALQVEYYGRVPVDLATQLMMLTPGRYSFAFQAEGDAKGESSRIAWKVVCHLTGRELWEISVKDATFAPKRFQGEFAVPKECSAQWLKLVGIAAEFPEPQSLTISDVRLRKMSS